MTLLFAVARLLHGTTEKLRKNWRKFKNAKTPNLIIKHLQKAIFVVFNFFTPSETERWEQHLRITMSKRKRKLSAAEKKVRNQRRDQFMTVFIHGKQKRVRRPPTIDGLDVDEFIRRNADPIWIHQNGLCDCMRAESAP